MNVNIHGHNVKVSADLEQFAHSKIDKLDRYLPNISEIVVELSVQHSNRGPDLAIAEITLRHTRGAILRAEERMAIENHDTMRAAIGGAVDKMYKRISRFKGKPKRRRERMRERYQATLEELSLAEDLPELAEEVASVSEEMVEVVRRKDIGVTAMNEEEAIEQMELLGHNFFVFYNTETSGVNVLYKRDSGGYGVLVPRLE